jgi:hypothetical protein
MMSLLSRQKAYPSLSELALEVVAALLAPATWETVNLTVANVNECSPAMNRVSTREGCPWRNWSVSVPVGEQEGVVQAKSSLRLQRVQLLSRQQRLVLVTMKTNTLV